jgi:hypothetical protein
MQFVMSHLLHFKMQEAFAESMGLYSSKKKNSNPLYQIHPDKQILGYPHRHIKN